jgi:hypothetical protein
MAKKAPDIYCRKGNPLGELQVNCLVAFGTASDESKKVHGLRGERVHAAADHIIRGLDHLTGKHGIDLSQAYKAVAKEVSQRQGLSAPALQEAMKVVQSHYVHGEKLKEVLLGRSV